MKGYILRSVAVALIALALFSSLASCSKKDNNEQQEGSDVSEVGQSDSTENGEKVYKYLEEGTDLGRREYIILNCERDQWDTISYVTAEDINGSAINDEVYRRTEYVKSTLNCKIKEQNYHNAKLAEVFVKDYDSGLNELALSYIQVSGNYGSMIKHMLEGRLVALDEIDTIHLEEDYYVKFLTDAMSIGGKHYTTASDMQLNYYEGAWVILFNCEILENNGIEFPYELVRSGNWTFSELEIMAKQAANLNGDSSWNFVSGGNAVYGLSFHYDGINAMMTSMGAQYGKKDATDLPVITCESFNFRDRAETLGEFFKSSNGAWLQGSGVDATGRNPRDLFLQGRIAFAGTALSIMKLASESGVSVGIVPMPMYDTDQEGYYCDAGRSGNNPVISSAFDDKEGIGLILDLMSFEANKSFEQMYFVDHLELRANTADEMATDNIEMLRVIRQNITVDPVLMLGVANDLRNAITASIEKGAGDISSTIEKNIGPAKEQCAQLREKHTVQ